ncbi:MAG: hypothetical protein R3B60_00385 [Candidatus Paceibacterota bacterium]
MPEDYEYYDHKQTIAKWLLLVAVLVGGLLVWLISSNSNKAPVIVESEILSEEEKISMQKAELDKLRNASAAQNQSTTTTESQKQELDKLMSEQEVGNYKSVEEQKAELDKLRAEMSE